MGDAKHDDLRVGSDSRLMFVGSEVTSDAGLLAYRELDAVLSLTEMRTEVLADSRLGQNKQHGLCTDAAAVNSTVDWQDTKT